MNRVTGATWVTVLLCTLWDQHSCEAGSAYPQVQAERAALPTEGTGPRPGHQGASLSLLLFEISVECFSAL